MWRIPAHHPPGEGADPRRPSAHAPALRRPCTGHGPLGPSHLLVGLCVTCAKSLHIQLRVLALRRILKLPPSCAAWSRHISGKPIWASPKKPWHLKAFHRPKGSRPSNPVRILWPDVDPVWNPSSSNPASPFFLKIPSEAEDSGWSLRPCLSTGLPRILRQPQRWPSGQPPLQRPKKQSTAKGVAL